MPPLSCSLKNAFAMQGWERLAQLPKEPHSYLCPDRPLLKKSESSSQFNTDESEAKEQVSGLHSLIDKIPFCSVQAHS